MLPQEISEQILTVGCEYRHPKGGVAQVMYNYDRYIFPRFKCIVNSGGTNKFEKLLKAITGWLQMFVILLIDREIKIVHIHTASFNSFRRSTYFIYLAKWFRKKVVLHIHGGGFKEYFKTNPKRIASILNDCDAIITLSESWKEYYQSITNGPIVAVVENIIAPPEKGDRLWKDDNKYHLLYLGLIDEQKGIFDLLDVLHEHLNEFNKKVVLHIGGNGKIGKLKDEIKQSGLADIVVYEGFVSGSKKVSLLFSCDAFILPSYTEGLPVSILEAMAYCKPILATPVGGIPEIVKHNENGILFRPGDKNGIHKALIQILNSKEGNVRMGAKSFQFIQSYFPNNVSEKLAALYRKRLL